MRRTAYEEGWLACRSKGFMHIVRQQRRDAQREVSAVGHLLRAIAIGVVNLRGLGIYSLSIKHSFGR